MNRLFTLRMCIWQVLAGLLLSACNSSEPPTPKVALLSSAQVNNTDTQRQNQWCTQINAHLKSLSTKECMRFPLLDSGAKSVRQQPIFLTKVSAQTSTLTETAPRILLLGGIHGDEYTATNLMFDWLPFINEPASHAYNWVMVPLLNPDGLMASPATRVNARGVDLNRNFPTPNWEKVARPYWEKRTGKDPRRYPGPAPLSEPESKWLHDFIEQYNPDVIVSVHAPYGVLDFDGPSTPPKKLGHLLYSQVGVYPGSLGNYNGVHKGVPVITIELSHAMNKPSPKETRKIWDDLISWLANHATQTQLAKLSSNSPVKR